MVSHVIFPENKYKSGIWEYIFIRLHETFFYWRLKSKLKCLKTQKTNLYALLKKKKSVYNYFSIFFPLFIQTNFPGQIANVMFLMRSRSCWLHYSEVLLFVITSNHCFMIVFSDFVRLWSLYKDKKKPQPFYIFKACDRNFCCKPSMLNHHDHQYNILPSFELQVLLLAFPYANIRLSA